MNARGICFFAFFAFLPAISAQAQLAKRAVQSLAQKTAKQEIHAASAGSLASFQNVNRAPFVSSIPATLPSTLYRAGTFSSENLGTALAQSVERGARVQAHKKSRMQRAVFYVQPTKSNAIPATGFVFQTMYEGKPETWGVVANHLVKWVGEELTVVLYKSGRPYSFQAKVVLQGNVRRADLALVQFANQKELLEVALPLKLAPQLPSLMENTSSFGYTLSTLRFLSTYDRTVLMESSARISTSYEFGHHQRAGMCGSPLLNARGQVLGVHCGTSTEFAEEQQPAFMPVTNQKNNFETPPSLPIERHYFWPIRSPSQRISHAVPASFIQDLVHAYHNKGEALQEIKWKGQVVGKLNLNERIDRIHVFNGRRLLRYYEAHDHEVFLNEQQLENFVLADDATHLTLEIETRLYHPEKEKLRRITLEVRSGKILKTEYF